MSLLILVWLIVGTLLEYQFSLDRSRIRGSAQLAAYYVILAPVLALRALKGPFSSLVNRFVLAQSFAVTEWFRN